MKKGKGAGGPAPKPAMFGAKPAKGKGAQALDKDLKKGSKDK